MIVAARINKVEAVREKDGPGKGLKVKVDITSVDAKGGDITIGFNYEAEYIEGIGKISMSGEVVDKQEKKVADEAKKSWKEKKDLPEEYRLSILNSINFIASSEGVFVAKIVRLAPPLVPPRITRGK